MAKTKEKGTGKKAASKAPSPRAEATSTHSSGRRKAANSAAPPIQVSSEERWRMVAVAAYHKAEQRGFSPERSFDDWLAAEQEIDALFGSK